MIKDKDDTNDQSAKMSFENKLPGHKDVLMTRERFSRDKCGGIQVYRHFFVISMVIIIIQRTQHEMIMISDQ